MLDIEYLYSSLANKTKKNYFKIEEIDIGPNQPLPLLGLIKHIADNNAPGVYLSAGIHGNEPADP